MNKITKLCQYSSIINDAYILVKNYQHFTKRGIAHWLGLKLRSPALLRYIQTM